MCKEKLASVISAGVNDVPASCFHTGSAKLRLNGLPVLMAIPINTPGKINIDGVMKSRAIASAENAGVRRKHKGCNRGGYYLHLCTIMMTGMEIQDNKQQLR